jgi:hypothetical protein
MKLSRTLIATRATPREQRRHNRVSTVRWPTSGRGTLGAVGGVDIGSGGSGI